MKRNRKNLLISMLFPFWISYLAYRAIGDRILLMAVLRYPPLTPSKSVFMFMYALCTVIFGFCCFRIWISVASIEKKRIALFGYCFQIAFIFFWQIIFGVLQEYFFATICGIVVCLIIFQNYKRFRKIDLISGILMLCCLAWYVFLVYLNFGIWLLN